MRKRIDSELAELNLDMIRMGALAERAVDRAMDMVFDCDASDAEALIAEDDVVDELERQIESKALQLITRQQSADKTRVISSALKMTTDLERICDQAADIAEIAQILCGYESKNIPVHLEEMSNLAIDMVCRAVDSYVKLDNKTAQAVIDTDDRVDDLFSIIKNELVDTMVADRQEIDRAIDLMQVAKYLERIGDHAENIAEWTLFATTGVHKNKKVF